MQSPKTINVVITSVWLTVSASPSSADTPPADSLPLTADDAEYFNLPRDGTVIIGSRIPLGAGVLGSGWPGSQRSSFLLDAPGPLARGPGWRVAGCALSCRWAHVRDRVLNRAPRSRHGRQIVREVGLMEQPGHG